MSQVDNIAFMTWCTIATKVDSNRVNLFKYLLKNIFLITVLYLSIIYLGNLSLLLNCISMKVLVIHLFCFEDSRWIYFSFLQSERQ